MTERLNIVIEERSSRAAADGLELNWKAAQCEIAKALKFDLFSDFLDGRFKGTVALFQQIK